MGATDNIALDLPVPATQTGQPNALCMTDATGNLTLTGALYSGAGGPGSGGTPLNIELTSMRNTDGSVVGTSAASGGFLVSNTTGTSLALVTETANNNTKTDVCIKEYTLPLSYKAGNNLTLYVNSNVSLTGTASLSLATVGSAAYLITNNGGTEGASIIGTGTQVLTGTATDFLFTATGATLTSGARILLKITEVLTEVASAAAKGQINSIRIA